jgi:hypothetical protein
MARRKHQEGKAVEAGQRHNEQLARATLGTLWEMSYDHDALKTVWEGHRIIAKGKKGVGRKEIEREVKAGVPRKSAADSYLYETEKKVIAALKILFPRWESAIARGDSDEFRKVADIIDLIKNEGAKSPLLAICSIFKWEAENTFWRPEEWPWTTSRLRNWIAFETGKEYPTNKIRSAAEQVGIPLADGRGKGKKKASRK